MAGLELKPDLSNGPHLVGLIGEKMLDRGYIIGIKPELHLLRFLPPFTVSRSEITNMCRNLKDVLIEIEHQGYQ